MARATPDAERISREYLEIWNERAYARIPDVISESFVMHDPLAPADEVPGPKGEVHGPDGLETFIQMVVTGFPDFHVEILDMRSGESVVMYEGNITMTHERNFYGIPPTGRGATFRYMGAIRIKDGQVSEHRVYHDLQTVFEQLKRTAPAIVPHLPTIIWRAIKRITSV